MHVSLCHGPCRFLELRRSLAVDFEKLIQKPGTAPSSVIMQALPRTKNNDVLSPELAFFEKLFW